MPEIDAETDLFGLLGNPVSHSLSPLLQNSLARRLELNAVYLSFQVNENQLRSAIDGCRGLGVKGLNITTPHKRNTMELMDEIHPTARATGAVNTVLFENKGPLVGYNTDVIGFEEALSYNSYSPEGKECFVFGAGGGAAAVTYALARSRAKTIHLANRSSSTAKKLVSKIKQATDHQDIWAHPLSCSSLPEKIFNSELIVNATSVGMWPNDSESIWNREDVFRSDQLVFDLVYNPEQTRFLRQAASKGAKTTSGLTMLIFQGLHSMNLWVKADLQSEGLIDELTRKMRGELH
ncbi:MAG: shikimate dehydrogenase [Candidatus Acetothermia bacterium]